MEKHTFFNFIFHLTRRLFIQLCCYHCQCHSIKSIFLHLVYSMALKKLSLYLYQMILYLPCSYSQYMQQGIESKWFAFWIWYGGREGFEKHEATQRAWQCVNGFCHIFLKSPKYLLRYWCVKILAKHFIFVTYNGTTNLK